jgi:hypothetical protein
MRVVVAVVVPDDCQQKFLILLHSLKDLGQ